MCSLCMKSISFNIFFVNAHDFDFLCILFVYSKIILSNYLSSLQGTKKRNPHFNFQTDSAFIHADFAFKQNF